MERKPAGGEADAIRESVSAMPLCLTQQAPCRIARLVCRAVSTVVSILPFLFVEPAQSSGQPQVPPWAESSFAKTNTPVVPSWLKPKTEKKTVRLPDAPDGWQRLEGCRFVEGKDHDGDSFHVTSGGKNYRFRIYFADCPETDLRDNRYEEQMVWFGVGMDDVLAYGEKAKAFTESALRKPFTVFTKWQNAMGAGNTPRFCGMVYTSEGENLSELLVGAGLARAHGFKCTDFPDRDGWRRFAKGMVEIEQQAKRGQLGIYRKVRSPIVARKSLLPMPSTMPGAGAVLGVNPEAGTGGTHDMGTVMPGVIDINSASKADLMKLPGIGEAFADKIIAARPFASAEDIMRVNGIGPKKYEEIAHRIVVR